jgi:hypothetical protein
MNVSVKNQLQLSMSVAVGSTIVRSSRKLSCKLSINFLSCIANYPICYTVCHNAVSQMISLLTLRLRSFMVTLGWVLDKPLALLFDPFESIVCYPFLHGNGSRLLRLSCAGFIYFW